MRLYNYLLHEAAHTHSTHIEELFITKGKQGLQDCLAGFEDIVTTLGSERLPVSLKVDGAPAILGIWLNGKFAVATKSLFNKTPKINYTNTDIDANHSGDLTRKLKICLEYLPSVIPQGKIYQGDYLFDKSSLKSSGNSYTFQPNTIIYSAEKTSEIGQRIAKAKLGICFHTEYVAKSNDPKDITLKGFGVRNSDLKQNNDVFLLDANAVNVSDELAFTSQERSRYNAWVKTAKSISIDWGDVQLYGPKIMQFNNFLVKQGSYGNLSASNMTTEFIAWSGKPDDFGRSAKSLKAMFDLLLTLLALKELIMNKLKQVSNLSTFVQKTNGDLIVTGHEGYVVTAGPANGVKLISRLEFARNNFSSDVLKGI